MRETVAKQVTVTVIMTKKMWIEFDEDDRLSLLDAENELMQDMKDNEDIPKSENGWKFDEMWID